MSLLDELWAFYQEHEYCGKLDAEDHRVWMTCSCGAVIVRGSWSDAHNRRGRKCYIEYPRSGVLSPG